MPRAFGHAFFEACEALAPLEPGFHEARRDLYNLYPALLHARLFGTGYPDGIDRTLRRLGYQGPGRDNRSFSTTQQGDSGQWI